MSTHISATGTGTGTGTGTSGTGTGTGSSGTSSNGALRGQPPTIFTGDRTKSAEFLREFRRWRLINRTNEAISIPFQRVLTALTYIKGPITSNWADEQDRALETKTTTGGKRETDESLWTDFEAAFKTMWTDSHKSTNAYDQLLKLDMKDLDIDTYIATFERLAADAEWEADAKGTIARFRDGLRPAVHRSIINHYSPLPADMAAWKIAARSEIGRMKEIFRSFGSFGGTQNKNQPQKGRQPYQTTRNNQPQPKNDGVVPMDVDATSTIPFKKLTPEERKQYMAEGRCFRCRQQGHMARECPKNTQPTRGSGTTRAVTTASNTPTTSGSTPTSTVNTTTTSTQKTIEEHFMEMMRKASDSQKADLFDKYALGSSGFQDANL